MNFCFVFLNNHLLSIVAKQRTLGRGLCIPRVEVGRQRECLKLVDVKVNGISYNESREIAGLTITNQDGKIVYNLIDKSATKDSNKEAAESQKNMAQEVFSESLYKELERTGVALDTVLQRYGISTIQDMDETTYKKAINSLKRTKTKVA